MNQDVKETLFGNVPTVDYQRWRIAETYFEPIKSAFLDSDVTEICVDRFDSISVEKRGRIEKTDLTFQSENDLQNFIVQIAQCLGQVIDDDNGIMDARLPDCSRLCCTLPSVTPQGATITLRVVPETVITSKDLLNFGSLSEDMLDYLVEHIRLGSNMLVSGNTGSGKTSLLRVLARYMPEHERVITCEDTQELYLEWLPYKVSMEAPKRENSTIKMKNLIEAALRMRPDRIWVGEIRHAPAADAFLQAINTGHSGCVTTIHANSCADAVTRLQYLIASAGLVDFDLARQQITGSVEVLVHATRHPDYGRKVMEIAEICQGGEIKPVFYYSPEQASHIIA